MKTHPIINGLVICLFLAACQQAAPATRPSPQPTQTALPPVPSMPASTLLPTATSTPAPTTPLAEPVYVTAFCTSIGKDQTTSVPKDAPVILTWGWEAKTQAQMEAFLQNNLTTVTLDGQAVEGKMDSQFTNARGQLEIVWQSQAGVLPPGKHIVTYAVKWKAMIDDGATTYGPGGQVESLQDECWVVVQ
jgi:hypothetical protein